MPIYIKCKNLETLYNENNFYLFKKDIKKYIGSINDYFNISTVQKRAVTGFNFEDKVCKEFNLEGIEKKINIVWNGVGGSWVKKIKNHNIVPEYLNHKDLENFYIDMDRSEFIKRDAYRLINGREINYEIKKYKIDQLKKDWKVYSEPIIKIAPSREKWKEGTDQSIFFKNSKIYNNFINKLTSTEWWKRDCERILKEITSSSVGIYLEGNSKSVLINKDKFDFKWGINTGNYNYIFSDKSGSYNRLSILFKLKS